MSCLSGGPEIITDGLVLHLDAASSKSYTSGSTTWRDLTINGRNGTLINGPGYNTDAGGNITFDGTNDYLSASTFSSLLNYQTAGSIDVVFKILSTPTVDYVGVCGFNPDNDTRVFWLETAELATDIVRLTWRLSSGGLGARTTGIKPSTNRSINHVICTYEVASPNVTFTVYVNGSRLGATTASGSLTNTPNTPFIIGVNGYGSYINANFYSAKIYNRALSATEVLQNYNETKTRFGLT